MKKITLSDTNYISRDISWMSFNERLLLEASEDIPIYEKLNFIGIYSNNLDEFYKVRVASLDRISESKGRFFLKERNDSKIVLKKIFELNNSQDDKYHKIEENIFNQLKEENIILLDESQLNESQKIYLKQYYFNNVSGYINPIILSKSANLSDVNDSHIYLAVKLIKKSASKVAYALIPLPVSLVGRFIVLPNENGKNFVIYLDDVVRVNLPFIFEGLGFDEFQAYAFKFSKDAEMEVESDPEEGILESITQAVKSRTKGLPVRAIFGEGIPLDLKEKLVKYLSIDETDMMVVGGKYHNHKDLMKFPYFNGENNKYLPWKHIQTKKIDHNISIISNIFNKDFMIHVPYESFDTVIELLQEAAISTSVSEIKMSIYRTASNSKVVRALEQASKNGKKVTCIVELMARFDESSNISISQKLIDSGCKVLTGVDGFKVHGKIIYIKFKNKREIAVISTGNFHEGNAKTYTDCLLFTSKKAITEDCNKIFELVSKPYYQPKFNKLLVSPINMQKSFFKLINQEIENVKKGKKGMIMIKINHITDPKIIEKLYEASAAGVEIKLLVRGNCSIITGIEGLSDNIEIHGIIDRYLEHSRIFIFYNNNRPRYFMGSADWMPRNLYNRIEVVTPINDEAIKKELQMIFDLGFYDNVKSFIVDGKLQNNRYLKGNKKIRSQEELNKYYNK